jgi:hypothetical protein
VTNGTLAPPVTTSYVEKTGGGGNAGSRDVDKPLLHLVFGGRVRDARGVEFVDIDQLHIVGIFPDYQTALTAWRGVSRATIDQADVKYVIVHLHRLLDPGHDAPGHEGAA